MAERPAIVIVGGGTAGWLTAGLLASRYGPDLVDITLVESPAVPILGVGEGTWPTIRQTLREMGVREADFLKACDATFKQGSRFVDWRKAGHRYTHPFTPPHRFGETDLTTAWLAEQKAPFDEAVCFQTALCDMGRAPKGRHSAEYEALGNYAYHFDAGKVATFLKEHCIARLGVRHVADDITGCRQGEDGTILSVQTTCHGDLAAGLFVDCSGQHGVLIDRIFHVPMVNCRDVLLVDKALAIQVPYPEADTPIASVTQASAQAAGWIWDIGLTTRRGVGYVYSSAYASADEARATLAAYVKATSGQDLPAEPREISINAGYRQTFWVKNCVAVGVSSGFVEPLEASSIAMIELSARHIADHLTFDPQAMAIEAQRFNAKLGQVWRDAIDFLKLHYVLSERNEPFWLANRDPASIPPSLADNLLLWRQRPPHSGDFPQSFQLFGPASYQYILYGMGYPTRAHTMRRAGLPADTAAALFGEVKDMAAHLLRKLGNNRDLLT
jgi:tryptophan halogenase